jgi:hypothetical protein
MFTFLDGLLVMVGLLAAGFTTLESWFSCELQGSAASLLGTGVLFSARLTLAIELPLVLSVRHWTTGSCSFFTVEGAGFDDGVATDELGVVAVAVALEKKPRILLCCLPVDAPIWLGADFAGVRATDLPAILPTPV